MLVFSKEAKKEEEEEKRKTSKFDQVSSELAILPLKIVKVRHTSQFIHHCENCGCNPQQHVKVKKMRGGTKGTKKPHCDGERRLVVAVRSSASCCSRTNK